MATPAPSSNRLVDKRFWKGRRVLVTGHTGFKGGWLTLGLDLLGAQVCGYSLPPEEGPSLFNAAGIETRCESILADIRDLKTLGEAVRHFQPEVVFHLAAQSLVRKSYQAPLLTFETNVLGTLNLLEACRTVPSVRSIVLVTTDKVYENADLGRAFREEDSLGGWDPYSSSKACAEIVGASYRKSFLHCIATARGGNVLGGGDWAVDRILPDFVRALCQSSPLFIRNPTFERPWQHVCDCLRGYLYLAENLWSDTQFAGSWNFGPRTDQRFSVLDLAEKFSAQWGDAARYSVSEEAQPLHEARLLTLDSTKSKALLGWEPQLDMDASVQLSVEWYRGQLEGKDARELCLSQLNACWL